MYQIRKVKNLLAALLSVIVGFVLSSSNLAMLEEVPTSDIVSWTFIVLVLLMAIPFVKYPKFIHRKKLNWHSFREKMMKLSSIALMSVMVLMLVWTLGYTKFKVIESIFLTFIGLEVLQLLAIVWFPSSIYFEDPMDYNKERFCELKCANEEKLHCELILKIQNGNTHFHRISVEDFHRAISWKKNTMEKIKEIVESGLIEQVPAAGYRQNYRVTKKFLNLIKDIRE